jgi:hypothetical protein
MEPRGITIAPKEEGKGRSFRAMCLAMVQADCLSPLAPNSDVVRPVLAVFAAGDAELRPFVTNLQLGRKAEFDGGSRRDKVRVEFLRSGGYQVFTQRETEGAIATVCIPDLFRIDPGMVDPDAIRFVTLPRAAWLHQEPEDRAEASELRDTYRMMVRYVTGIGFDQLTEDHLMRLAPLSYLFAAFLDRRTRCPILADGRFYLHLLLACLRDGLAGFARDKRPSGYGYHDRRPLGYAAEFDSFVVEGATEAGFGGAIAFKAKHEEFETLLAAETTVFVQKTGTPGRPLARRH